MEGVWIVDDDQSIRWVLERALLREGFAVRTFERANDCLQALVSDRPRVLISDIRMPGTDGINMLSEVKKGHADLPVIIMTAYSDLDSAVSAFQAGAYEYLAKPFDLSNALELIRRAVDQAGEQAVNGEVLDADIGILGKAPAMQEVFRAIGRLSTSPVTVLVTGESGTGKELVARALHQHSTRADKPFVAINTAAIPTELLESELFGHERGAFTGAQTMRRGRFEQAAQGTLFLDEIGDMPAQLQTRLLRVLSEGRFYRVGGTESIEADVRVIAATHQALEDRVASGQFREDLFHRLNVIRLRLPSLRERREDIPLLAAHFLRNSAQRIGSEPKSLSDEALSAICQFDWPGNVRQLENVCHWLMVMAPGQQVGIQDLPPELRDGGSSTFSSTDIAPAPVVSAPVIESPIDSSPGGQWSGLLSQFVNQQLQSQSGDYRSERSDLMAQLTREFEATVLSAALTHCNGRRIDAAARLGVGRNTITRKIAELNLDL